MLQKKYLIVKPSSLGDIIQALVAVQSIKVQEPEALIYWVVADRFVPFARQAACIDRIITFRRQGGLGDWLTLWRDIRRERYDAVLDMQGLLRSALMTWAARSRLKIGRTDAREGAQLFCHRLAPLPLAGVSRVHILLNFLPLIGLTPTPATLQLRPSDSATAPTISPRTILIFPSSRGADRIWPHFATFTSQLLQALHGTGATIAWVSDEALTPPPGVLNLSPNRDLAALPTLIAQGTLIIANDSGPAHLAAALGRPLVALYGPTDPVIAGAFGPRPELISNLRAPTGRMADLPVAEVLRCTLAAFGRC